MTFHARLTELLDKSKNGLLEQANLRDYLHDHAEAIEELVRVAGNVTARVNTEASLQISMADVVALKRALEKMNRSENET